MRVIACMIVMSQCLSGPSKSPSRFEGLRSEPLPEGMPADWQAWGYGKIVFAVPPRYRWESPTVAEGERVSGAAVTVVVLGKVGNRPTWCPFVLDGYATPHHTEVQLGGERGYYSSLPAREKEHGITDTLAVCHGGFLYAIHFLGEGSRLSDAERASVVASTRFQPGPGP